MEKDKDIRIEPGTCPKCGSPNLEFDGSVPHERSIHYPYTCQNCSFDGEEVYSLEFAEHISSDGKDVFQV